MINVIVTQRVNPGMEQAFVSIALVLAVNTPVSYTHFPPHETALDLV